MPQTNFFKPFLCTWCSFAISHQFNWKCKSANLNIFFFTLFLGGFFLLLILTLIFWLFLQSSKYLNQKHSWDSFNQFSIIITRLTHNSLCIFYCGGLESYFYLNSSTIHLINNRSSAWDQLTVRWPFICVFPNWFRTVQSYKNLNILRIFQNLLKS